MNEMILDFKQWFVLSEIGDDPIDTKRGSELFQDPAMECAMYILYRQAYDPVSARDREEDITHHMTTTGASRQDAEAQFPEKPAWSHREWTRPSGGGTRAPAWLFTGVFPNEQDLEVIRQAMQGGAAATPAAAPMESVMGGKAIIQQVADQLLPTLKMSYAGGLAWRDDKADSIKLTGLWGNNKIAKIRAGATVVHNANQSGKEIFTGADAALKEVIEKAETMMPSFHSKGKVPAPTLGLQQPPKEVIPLLYELLIQHPAAKGSGEWQGYNPETGGMYFQLSGSGKREKFIFGNRPMWKNAISKALQKAGVSSGKAMQAKQALQSGRFMATMAVTMINQALRKAIPGNWPDVSANGLLWLLGHLEC
jgi:hypothetical protein